MRIVFYIVVIVLLAGVGCRKDVTLKLPEYHQKVVIEASIETGASAIVFLSWSVPYFEQFDFSHPEKVFIKGAQVTITDGTESETLQEADPTTGYLYLGGRIRGAEGKTYTLQVTVNDRTFRASTSIGRPVRLDSVYFKGERDSLGFIWQKFSEPRGSGAAYRWMSKRLGKDYFYAAPFNSVFDDKFIDGKEFEFAYDRGRQPGAEKDEPAAERGLYKRGDTVVVKFSTIGRREYEFWTSYYMNKTSNGNPFSAPANVKSMFDDYENAFGAFVGYAPTFDTLVIPKK